jgi:hypothetical protein
MKSSAGIFLILSFLTLAGCATPTSEFNKAKEINTVDSYKAYVKEYPYGQYTRIAKDKIAELEEAKRRKEQIKINWDKLRKGMSVEEVDSLIGPLNRGAVNSIKFMSRNRNASTATGSNPEAEAGFPYRGRYFFIKFDATGRLESWSLK